MAIIYTYPTKGKAADADLIIISDSEEKKMTKQISVGNLLADINKALDELEKLVAVNTENIASLTSIIGTLQEQVASLEGCCEAFNKFAEAQTAINDDFEARIAKLEASPIGDISELEKEVSDLKGDVETNTGDIDGNTKEIDSNTKEIETVKVIADTAKGTADTAKETADSAKATADSATEAAATADSKATEAATAAAKADGKATEAQSLASTADTRSTEAEKVAETAQETASGAVETAAAASSSASEALKASVDGVEAKSTIDSWEADPASSPFAPAEAEEPPVEE